jgi:hypothetical protein
MPNGDAVALPLELVSPPIATPDDVRTLGFINLAQNDIIQLFSVLAVIFMPPTLIASIYGMNFKEMPELEWHSAILFTTVTLLGHRHDGRVNHLATARDVTLRLQMLAKSVKQPLRQPASRTTTASCHRGMRSSMPARKNRVNDSRSRT